MKLQNPSRAAIAALVAALGLAGSASAAPISMVSADGDGLVQLDAVVGSNSNTVAGILIDFGAPSQASFRVVLGSTPTTATVFSLNLMGTSPLYTSTSWQTFAIDRERVRFTAGEGTPALPEPAAALCFAAGLALVASRLRRP